MHNASRPRRSGRLYRVALKIVVMEVPLTLYIFVSFLRILFFLEMVIDLYKWEIRCLIRYAIDPKSVELVYGGFHGVKDTKHLD